MLIRNRDYVFRDNGELITDTLINTLEEHSKSLPRLNTLEDYYNGKHPILDRQLSDTDAPNNRLIINYAEYISDFAASYFMGNEIDYIAKTEEMQALEDALNAQHIHTIDAKNARDLSKYGLSYELVYMSTDERPIPKSANIKPANAYIVADDSVEEHTLLGVRRYQNLTADNEADGEIVKVYTDELIYTYLYLDDELELLDDPESHEFGAVPMIEYQNNSNATADYESVLSLIDAYNVLMSDRVNDKEKFVQSLLVVYGVLAGDTSQQKVDTVRELKALGMLEMPAGTNAEYLTKSLSESDTEILKDAIKNDIHKISKVPDMTDQNFASNASGVAMRYKLLGLEQLTKTKETYYKMGLRDRLSLYETIYIKKGHNELDVSGVEIQMTRSLPVNELEIAQMVVQLKDTVSDDTLLSQIPFVQNVPQELERLEEQEQAKTYRYQQSFGSYDFQTLQAQESQEPDVMQADTEQTEQVV